jgi:hypothetical protein
MDNLTIQEAGKYREEHLHPTNLPKELWLWF